MLSIANHFKLNLTLRFGILLALFLILLFASYIFISSAIEAKEHDSVMLNFAGKQRMLAQKYVREINLVLIGLVSSDWKLVMEQKKVSANTAQLFESTHRAFLDGGHMLLSPGGSDRVYIPPVENSEIRENLDAIWIEWTEMKRAAVMALRSEPESMNNNEYLDQLQARLVGTSKELDHFATMMQQDSEVKLRQVERYQLIMMGAGGLLFGVIMFFAYWKIVKPLDNSVKQVKNQNQQLASEITVRKKTEEDLVNIQSRHEEAQRLAKMGHWTLDLIKNELAWSDEVYRIFEVAPEQFGNSYEDFLDTIHPDDREFVDTAYRDSVKKNEHYNIVHRLLMKDGTIKYVNERCQTFFGEDGKPLQSVGTVQDITEREMAEKERSNMQNQLVSSEKMASIGQLAAGVAHEINNPLGFVCSNLNTLSEYIEDVISMVNAYKEMSAILTDEQAYNKARDKSLEIKEKEEKMGLAMIIADASDLVKETKSGIDRVAYIVQSLKDFSHPGVDAAEMFDINKSLKSTIQVAWHEIKYKAVVEEDYGDIPQILGRSQQINQVFMNILVNAAHAIEEKGVINVSTFVENNNVVVKIKDSGKGISEESLNKIFDPFFTTKPVGAGTGLGLSIAYGIVKDNNGTIAVESKLGEGTTFTLRFPYKEAA
jgi:PAS domain S-box-containing protein